MASSSSTARLSPQPDTSACMPGPAHLLERRDLLADHHLGHAGRAEVHRGVALDHEHHVAERRDVGPARGRRAEQAADLRHLTRQPHLVVEDAPGAPAAGEQLDLVGDAGAGGVDQPDQRDLLGQRRLGGADHLLDGAGAPRAGLHHRVVGDHHTGRPSTRPRPGDHAVGGEPVGQRVGQQPVLHERARVEQQVDALAGRVLADGPQLRQPGLRGGAGLRPQVLERRPSPSLVVIRLYLRLD